MNAVLVIAGLVLAAVFATAGVAKLADLEGSRAAMVGFGLPRRIAAPFGTLLPAAELAAAALLIAGAVKGEGVLLAGALSAFALLAIFCAGIALSLLRGRAPDCHCFGQLQSAPVSGRTLARNGALLSLAAFVASGGDPVLTVGTGTAALAVLGVVTLFSRGRVPAQRAEQVDGLGLDLGSRAPDFELATPDGPPLTLDALLRPGHPVMLVFTDSECEPCIALAPRIAEWQRSHADDLTIAVIERHADLPPPAIDAHGRQNVLLHRHGEVARRYRAEGTPSGLLVGADGRIASEVAPGGPAIEALVARALPGTEPSGTRVPAAPRKPALRRRELLARAATGWAAVAGLIGAPAWATGQLQIKCRHERCGDRCCPRKAKCRRSGKRKVCICPDGRPVCRDRCCPETFICRGRGRRRRCACPDGYIVCSRRCVKAQTNPSHCGRCGRECPLGTSCVDGECVGGDGTGTGPGGSGECDCPLGQACCEGQCIDLDSSEEHCGECGQTCVEGKTCCDGHCQDIESDPRNCGRCGRRCAGDEVCSEGECRGRCRRGLTNCNGQCVDVSSDDQHCGGCQPCAGPFDTGECCNGECCDYNGSTCCPGGCKNLALDDDNCGACGNVCPSGSFCRFGVCSPF